MEEKLNAIRQYLFFVEINDISMNRIEWHEKIEELWNIDKDNEFLRYILHNLDLTIGLIIDRELSIKEKIKYENKLKILLDGVKDWKERAKEITLKDRLKRGNTSGSL